MKTKKYFGKSKKENSHLQFAILQKLFPNCKRSQSEVIGAVLMILIVIVAAGIIMSFVIPFVINKIKPSKCLDVLEQIEITEHRSYSCFDSANNQYRVQVHVGENDSLEGFVLEFGGASSNSVKIEKETIGKVDGIYMYNKADSDPLELPGDIQEKTYVINKSKAGDAQNIKLYPIVNGETCKSADIMEKINLCI